MRSGFSRLLFSSSGLLSSNPALLAEMAKGIDYSRFDKILDSDDEEVSGGSRTVQVAKMPHLLAERCPPPVLTLSISCVWASVLALCCFWKLLDDDARQRVSAV